MFDVGTHFNVGWSWVEIYRWIVIHTSMGDYNFWHHKFYNNMGKRTAALENDLAPYRRDALGDEH